MVTPLIQKFKYYEMLNNHIHKVIKTALEVVKLNIVQKSLTEEEVDYLLKVEVFSHDYTRLDDEEFDAYRQKYAPSEQDEEIEDFEEAYQTHLINNPHHWQSWSQIEDKRKRKIHCVHMIAHWIAKNKNAVVFFKFITSDPFCNFNKVVTPKERMFIENVLVAHYNIYGIRTKD